MKHIIKNSLLVLLLLVMGVVGCSKDEALLDNPNPINTTDPTDHTTPTNIPMSISVTDEGYTDSDSRTRASENGYLTTFTNGDKIGIYMVENGVITRNNILFTYNGEDWTGDGIYYDKKAKYFAYYPYQNDLNGDLKLDASTATEFFDGVISAWTPSTDQSTYAKYNSQDLMVANGIVAQNGGENTLTLGMTHAMAMVVIETPTKVYNFINNNEIPDYIIPTSNNKFYDFIPYNTSLSTYRLLVKPNQSDAGNLVGSYIGIDGKKEYRVTKNSIKAGNYKYSKVDGGIIQITHNLQAGDYYLKDGSLINQNTVLSAQQKAYCIGIVYWVGDPTLNDRALKADRPECIHGLVVAKNHVESFNSQMFPRYSSIQNWLNKNHNNKFQPVQTGYGANDPLNNIQGYNNTKAIELFNSNVLSFERFDPVQKVIDYRKTVPAPEISSDWYIPSAKELTILCAKDIENIWYNRVSLGVANRDLINAKLSSIDGTQISRSLHWSSSEHDTTNMFVHDFDNASKGELKYIQKMIYQGTRARFSLAF